MNKEFTHKGVEFILPKWTMREQLERQKVVLPVISGPLTTAIAYSDHESESMMIAAVVSGLVESISEVDMVSFSSICLKGVVHKNENSVKTMTTLDELEKLGWEASDVYILLAAIVKVNYGGLLKKDLQDSLTSLMEL